MAASVALALTGKIQALDIPVFLRHLLKELTGQAANMCYSLRVRRLIQLRLRQ